MKYLRKLKYPITILIFILIICYIIYLKKSLNISKYQDIDDSDELFVQEEVIVEEKKEICSVDIKGAVKTPGVYEIECESYVNDVIKLSGGLNKDADTSIINLAKRVTDQMVIIVYTKEEVKNSNVVETVIKEVEKECVCPNIQNDGCINDEIDESIGDTGLININSADETKLQELPGIGESKAKAIIKYREENGNFKTIEDLLNVEGIGNSLYEQIKIYITT